MRIVVHAGIHRTGSTSLQQFLAANREALARRGIGYPGMDVHHQALAWSLKRGDADVRDVEALMATQPDMDMTILSGEDFSIHKDLNWLRDLAGRHEVEAVFYLRRQDHWIMSWYNQHVKWPFSKVKSAMTPEEFLNTIDDFYWLDFHRMLENWSSILGVSRVGVGVLEQGFDVVDDFVGRTGMSRDGLSFEKKRANDSLPVHTLEIARNLGLYDMIPGERMRTISALRAGLADKAQNAGTVFSAEERNRILDRFEESNRWVAENFFDRSSLFAEPRPEAGAPYFQFPDISRQELIREWIAPVLKELLKARR